MSKVQTIAPKEKQQSKKRIAAYCRVSSDSADQHNSYAAQIAYYTDYAQSHDTIDFVGIYADEGLTGTKTEKREEFLRMMQDCRDGKIDRILVKSISRFSRNTADCLNALRELKTLGVTVLFEKENLDTGVEKTEIMLTAMGCFAQEESMSISKNIKVGVRMRMKNGTYLLSVPPYGYKVEDRELVVIPEQAEVVRFIFDSYANGMGICAIASLLNERGVPRNDKGGIWRQKTVDYIIKNEKYIGDELLQKSYMSDSLPYKKRHNKGELNQYYYTGCHEAIISREVFESAQRIRKSRYQRYHKESGAARPQNTYAGLIVCGNCQSHYIRKYSNGKAPYWSCGRHNRNASDCPSRRIRESELDAAFVRMFNKLRLNRKTIITPTVKLLLALKNKVTMNNSELVRIDKELNELNGQLAVMTKLRTKELMDSDSYLEQATEIVNRVNRLRSKRRLFLNKTEGDECISELKRLSAIMDKAGELAEFDAAVFRNVVKSITLSDSDEIVFHLLGGMKITEHIRR